MSHGCTSLTVSSADLQIPEQTAEEQEAPSPSKGVVERHAGLHPLEPFCPPTATIAPPRVEGWADDHDPRPSAGPSMSNFGGGCQGINSVGENAVKQPEIADESSTSAIQGSVDAQLKTAPPTTDVLPLCCRMCGSPPTVATRPTVTTCGHLFCLEYVTKIPSNRDRTLTPPHQVYRATGIIHVPMSRVQ